jgi:hypothetical protein
MCPARDSWHRNERVEKWGGEVNRLESALSEDQLACSLDSSRLQFSAHWVLAGSSHGWKRDTYCVTYGVNCRDRYRVFTECPIYFTQNNPNQYFVRYGTTDICLEFTSTRTNDDARSMSPRTSAEDLSGASLQDQPCCVSKGPKDFLTPMAGSPTRLSRPMFAFGRVSCWPRDSFPRNWKRVPGRHSERSCMKQSETGFPLVLQSPNVFATSDIGDARPSLHLRACLSGCFLS